MRNYLGALALIAAAFPAAPAMARQMNGYTIRTTVMHAGPDYDYPAVQRLRRNSSVKVYGCLRNWSWCDVATRYDRGWVRQRDIVIDYQGRRRGITASMGVFVLSFTFGSYWDDHYRSRPFYAQRPQWQRQYDNNYRQEWGPRPRPQVVAPQPHQSGRPTPPRVSPPRQPAPQMTNPVRTQRDTQVQSGANRTQQAPAQAPAARPNRGNAGQPKPEKGHSKERKSGQ